ncbi:MAG: phosphatidic acid phosphatase [Dehalococcoidales bacterium]|nr:phosphatidic acid phosphatase [Dehalococcoidales bacterium]
MRERLAGLTSNILNPFLLSFVVIILLAVESTDSASEALKWALISIALSVLPVFVVIMCLVRQKKLEGFFANPRQQRNGIYILASALGVIGCGVMWYFKAPELLRVTFIAGLVAIVVFMVINRFWKISLHTAFMSASVTIVTIVYGTAGVLTILLLPALAWARIRLNQHSPAQVVTGALLSAVILLVMFWGFGVL